MAIAPSVVSAIRSRTKATEFGYYWACGFFVFVNMIGLVCNTILYCIDLRYNDGVLNMVEVEDQLNQLILSPPADASRKDLIKASLAKASGSRQLVDYQLDDSLRDTLKRSLAT